MRPGAPGRALRTGAGRVCAARRAARANGVRPQRLALVARIGRSGRRLFDRFEIQHQPAVGRQRAELRKVGQPDDPFVRRRCVRAGPLRASGYRRSAPASRCAGACALPALYHSHALSRTSGELASSASLNRSSEDQQVTRVAGERSFAPTASRPPLCPARSNSSAVPGPDFRPRRRKGRQPLFVSGTSVQRFEPGVREKFCVGSAVDQLLDAAVKARREPQVVRRERDAQAGADAQRIGGQQHRRAERLAVLRRYRDDQPPDEPFGKGVQGTVIGGVERCRAEAGNAPSREVRQAAPRQFALDCPARDCQPGPGIGNGMQVYSGGRTGARGRSSAPGRYPGRSRRSRAAAGCLRERFRSSCGSGLELRPASA